MDYIEKPKQTTVHTKLLSLYFTSTDWKMYAPLLKNTLAPLLTCTCILWCGCFGGFVCLFWRGGVSLLHPIFVFALLRVELGPGREA